MIKYDLFRLVNNFYVLAALEEEINKLTLSEEVKKFILDLEDKALKGKIFSVVKKNPNINLSEVKSEIDKIKAQEEEKNRLKMVDVPSEWLPYFNACSEKLKIYLRALARNHVLPSITPTLSEDLDTIDHFITERLRNQDISFVEFDELLDSAKDWEKSFTKIDPEITSYKQLNIVYGPEWKNKKYNGHFITEITHPDDLKLEGKLLLHCVGGYDQFVNRGEKRIFSLRTSNNTPLITIDCTPNLYGFTQTFGYNNTQPNTDQMTMINEWKQSLHSKDKILSLSNSFYEDDQIKASQFMNYNDPDYKKVIDDFIETKQDSRQGFYGNPLSNDPKNVLQALAANDTLSEECYTKIYNKCKKNISTLFNLIRNPKIGDDLFKQIYQENMNKGKSQVLSLLASSFAIGRPQNNEILFSLFNNNKENKEIIAALLNNPSIKSSVNKQLINELPVRSLTSVFDIARRRENINVLEPKFIDDVLESNQASNMKVVFINLLLTAKDISDEILEKLYKLFNIKSFYKERNNLLFNILLNNPQYLADIRIYRGSIDSKDLINKVVIKLIQMGKEDVVYSLNKNLNLIDLIVTHTSNPQWLIKIINDEDYNKVDISSKKLAVQRLIDSGYSSSDIDLNKIKLESEIEEDGRNLIYGETRLKNLNPERIQDLIYHPNSKIREAVADQTDNLEYLKILSKDSDIGVRSSVARNKNIDDEIISRLIKDKSIHVRTDLARLTTNDSAIEVLFKDKDSKVVGAVITNLLYRVRRYNSPADIKRVEEMFMENPKLFNLYSKSILAQETNNEEILNKLATETHRFIINSILERPDVPEEILETFSKNRLPGIRRKVAEKTKDWKILFRLSSDKNEVVREAVKNNPFYQESIRYFGDKLNELATETEPETKTEPDPEDKLPPILRVGLDINAWCTRCKMNLTHRIISVHGLKYMRVECLTCHGQHMYYKPRKIEKEKREEPVIRAVPPIRRKDRQRVNIVPKEASLAEYKRALLINRINRFYKLAKL